MASPGQCRRRRGLAEFAARLRGRVRVGLPIAVKQRLTCGGTDIESISHKGLRRFFETGNAKGLVGDVSRPRKMLAFIDAAASFDELAVPPNYGLHELVGDKAGRWAMTVTRNWRLTFTKLDEYSVAELDLEDYH
jgi:proteic killer suppression protein